MDLHGLPVTFLDTAGLRSTNDHIEKIGIARAVERAKSADLRVFLVENNDLPDEITPQNADIVVNAKADLHSGEAGVSGLTGQGVDSLISRITTKLETRASVSQTAMRARHRHAIDAALYALNAALDEVKAGPDRSELAAEELRTAIRALDSLIGRVDVEDLLDEIFTSFCLGK